MAPKARSHYWRLCRIYFRRFRVTVQLIILALLGLFIYLSQVGVPRFMQRPLLERLRERGLDLEVSRLRLRWYRGLVAQDVRFGQPETTETVSLFAKDVELDLHLRALLRGQLEVDGLSVNDGRMEWRIPETNAPARTLAITDIQSRLRLLPGDEWSLDDFRARFAGANFFLSGTVTNASSVRDWPFFQGRPAPPGTWPARLRRLADNLGRVSFATPPEFRLMLSGDARDLRSFSGHLTLAAHAADTPWGNVSRALLSAHLFAATTNAVSRSEISLQADDARTPWASAQDLNLELHFLTAIASTNLVEGELTLNVTSAQTRWATVTNAQFTANWVHSLTNPIPLSGHGEFYAASADSEWARARNVGISAAFVPATDAPPADASWNWWTNLQPYQLDWAARLRDFESAPLVAEEISLGGRWLAPRLAVTNVQARLHGGRLETGVELDVASCEAAFRLFSDFDVKPLLPLLPEEFQPWLKKLSWTGSPRLEADGVLTLPGWTNQQPDWVREIQPTLRLTGELAVTNVEYQGFPADWIRSRFDCTNRLWRVTDLEIARPEGGFSLNGQLNDSDGEFHAAIHSTMNLLAVRPALPTNLHAVVDLVTLAQPPEITAELWGRLDDFDRLGARGHVAATNFTVRGESASRVDVGVSYTNRVLSLLAPQLWRGAETGRADGLALDFNARRTYFTNVQARMDAMPITRAIGPPVAEAIAPYHFREPPTVQLDGFVSMVEQTDVDMRFQVEGGPFDYWQFKVPHIRGNVHWYGDKLLVTNVQADFYFGQAGGSALFVFVSPINPDFQAEAVFTNVNLRMLLTDLAPRTDKVEGWINGQIVITNGNVSDPNSLRGYGEVELWDGLIWEIPIFGVLSGPLNGVLPGLGKSRITRGTAGFIVTNGVIYSDSLEMRASTMRLHYHGSVDFQFDVDARVEAELLRDTWMVGRVISLALWPVTKMFEYKITGTLDQPVLRPLNIIPRMLLMPFRPLQTVGDLFTPPDSDTNAPPQFTPPPVETPTVPEPADPPTSGTP